MKATEFTLSKLKKSSVNVEYVLNGKMFKITAYFVSQKDRNGRPCKGRQTAIDYILDGQKYEDVSTENFKNEFFPNREKTTHATKTKTYFEQKLNELLENATKAQLEYTTERITIYKAQIVEREKQAKAEKIEALKAQLAQLENE